MSDGEEKDVSATKTVTSDQTQHLTEQIENLIRRVALLESAKEEHDTYHADPSTAINDPQNPFKYTILNMEVEEQDIYPEGDVVFVCTTDEGKDVKIRVSSVIIILSSPVLKIMLGPNFKEGHTLRAHSHVEITLPDDDPIALATIFRAMHLQFDEEDFVPTTPLMVDIAHLHDKYKFTDVMWVHYEALFFEVVEEKEAGFYRDPAGAGDLLIAAVMLLPWDAERILRIARAITFNSKSRMECSPKGATLLPILGLDIFAQLEEQRLKFRSRLSDFLENKIQRLLSQESYSQCPNPDLSFLNIVRALKEAQLWPAKELSQHTSYELADAMAELRPPYPGAFCSLLSEKHHEHNCYVHNTVKSACQEINGVGKLAKKELESLEFSRELNSETGKMVGFTTTQEEW